MIPPIKFCRIPLAKGNGGSDEFVLAMKNSADQAYFRDIFFETLFFSVKYFIFSKHIMSTFSMDPTLTAITSLSTVLFAGADISANAPLQLNTVNLENTHHAKYQKLADISLNWFNYGSFYKMKILHMGFDGADLSQNLADTDSSGQIQFLAGGGTAQKFDTNEPVGSGTFTSGVTAGASSAPHWWQVGASGVDISLNLRDVSNADAPSTDDSTNSSNVVYNEWASNGGLTTSGGLYPKSSTSVPSYAKDSTDYLTDLYMSQVTYDIFTDTQYSKLFDNESSVRTTVIEAVNNTAHAFENLGRIGTAYDTLVTTNESLMGSQHFTKDASWCDAGLTSGSNSSGVEISDAQRMFALFQRETEDGHDLSTRLDQRFNNIAAAVNAESSLDVSNEQIIWGGRTTIIVDASGTDSIEFTTGADISQDHGNGAGGTGTVIGTFTQDALLKTVLVIDVSSGSFDLVGDITDGTDTLDAGRLLAVATGPMLDYVTTSDSDSGTLPVGTKLTQGTSIGYVTAVSTDNALQIVVEKGKFNITAEIASGESGGTSEYAVADLTSFTHNAAHGVEKMGEYWGDHDADVERDVIIYLPIEAGDKIRMNSYFTVNATSINAPYGDVVISSGNIGDGSTAGGATTNTYDRSHLNYYVECTATASDEKRSI